MEDDANNKSKLLPPALFLVVIGFVGCWQGVMDMDHTLQSASFPALQDARHSPTRAQSQR